MNVREDSTIHRAPGISKNYSVKGCALLLKTRLPQDQQSSPLSTKVQQSAPLSLTSSISTIIQFEALAQFLLSSFYLFLYNFFFLHFIQFESLAQILHIFPVQFKFILLSSSLFWLCCPRLPVSHPLHGAKSVWLLNYCNTPTSQILCKKELSRYKGMFAISNFHLTL